MDVVARGRRGTYLSTSPIALARSSVRVPMQPACDLHVHWTTWDVEKDTSATLEVAVEGRIYERLFVDRIGGFERPIRSAEIVVPLGEARIRLVRADGTSPWCTDLTLDRRKRTLRVPEHPESPRSSRSANNGIVLLDCIERLRRSSMLFRPDAGAGEAATPRPAARLD